MSEPIDLPSQSAFFHAILRHLATQPEGDRRTDIHEAMPALLGLTEAQKPVRLSNSSSPTVHSSLSSKRMSETPRGRASMKELVRDGFFTVGHGGGAYSTNGARGLLGGFAVRRP